MSEERNTRGKMKCASMNKKMKEFGRMRSPQKSPLLFRNDNLSPVSSPLKGPLDEDDSESGSTSFKAKSFYGLKGSSFASPKENYSSPKKTNTRHAKQLPGGNQPKILQDVRLNEKLLDRIAASPIKQAVLQSCSVEDFRRLYRDEILEIEQEEKLADRRITRKLSKIVWKRDEDSDCDNDRWDSSSSNDGISFKISNRGFDIDSVSNSSSSLRSEDGIKPMRQDITISSAQSTEFGTPRSQDTSTDGIQEEKGHLSAATPTERKFFKSRSLGKSVGSSSVYSGKGFNIRFVRKGGDTSVKKNVKKRASGTPRQSDGKTTFAEKLRMSCQGPLVSTSLTASSGSDAASSQDMPCNANSGQSKLPKVEMAGKYNGQGFDDDDDLDFVVMRKDCSKTYDELSPKRQRLDRSNGNESMNGSMSDYSPDCQDKCRVGKDVELATPGSSNSSDHNDSATKDDGGSQSSKKLFPIFRTSHLSGSPKLTTESGLSVAKLGRSGNKIGKDDSSQMIIDAGQKNFGATQCRVCGMVYCHADPADQTAHAKFHKRLLEVLRFPGWKKERVVQEIPSDCGKIVLILSDDPRSHRKKVEEIFEVMARELGSPGCSPFANRYQKVFFYISVERDIEGCCVAEPIKEGHRVIPGDLDSNDASGKRPWCCEKVPEPALIGISRLWVAARSRRNGVASRLIEAVQQWFDYGSLIPKDKVAFSDPTPDGRKFAQKFSGTPTFLVYKYV